MLKQILFAATAGITLGGWSTCMVSAAAQAGHIYPFYEQVPVAEPGFGVIINSATAVGNEFMDAGYFKSLGSAPYAGTQYPDPLPSGRHR